MDTSETYIKMCQKATELCDHILYEGDFYYSDNWDEDHPLVSNCTHVGVDYDNYSGRVRVWGRVIWLPRQDQLQEMVKKHLWQLNGDFMEWLFDLGDSWHTKHEHLDFKSMEQLWLAFVMKELYKKRWDGEDWVDAK